MPNPKVVYAAVNDALASAGMEVRRKGIYVKNLSPGVLGWLGLNVIRETSLEAEVYPVIGIKFEELEQLHCRLYSIPYRQEEGPTLARPLCYLMPAGTYRTWVLRSGGEDSEARTLAAAVEQFGYPFMGRYTSIRELLPVLRNETEVESEAAKAFVGSREEYLPFALYLTGRTEEALRVLDDQLVACLDNDARRRIETTRSIIQGSSPPGPNSRGNR